MPSCDKARYIQRQRLQKPLPFRRYFYMQNVCRSVTSEIVGHPQRFPRHQFPPPAPLELLYHSQSSIGEESLNEEETICHAG